MSSTSVFHSHRSVDRYWRSRYVRPSLLLYAVYAAEGEPTVSLTCLFVLFPQTRSVPSPSPLDPSVGS